MTVIEHADTLSTNFLLIIGAFKRSLVFPLQLQVQASENKNKLKPVIAICISRLHKPPAFYVPICA